MFDHDYLINCYGWELDIFQRIVKDFFDYSDCMLYALKINSKLDVWDLAIYLNSINVNLYK